MDKNSLISKLNKGVPGAVLENRRFGRSGATSIWIEAQSIQKVGIFLKQDTELKFDCLENLSVVEFEKVLVTTYFLASTATKQSLILRVSSVPDSPQAEVSLPSIRTVWPMGDLMEREAEEMFGIRFRLDSEKDIPLRSFRLPEGWEGFPLRKSYEFPKEVLGITHSRPFNRQSQKKPKP